jgi:hypothetical protein
MLFFSKQFWTGVVGKFGRFIIPNILKIKVNILTAILCMQWGLQCNLTYSWKKHPMFLRNLTASTFRVTEGGGRRFL